MRILGWLKGGEPPPPEDSEGSRLVAELMAEARPARRAVDPADTFEAGRRILAAETGIRIEALHAAMREMASLELGVLPPQDTLAALFALKSLVTLVLRSRPPLSEQDVRQLLERAVPLHDIGMGLLPAGPIVSAAERLVEASGPPEGIRQVAHKLADRLKGRPSSAENRRLAARLEALFLPRGPVPLNPHDPWAVTMREDLEKMPPAAREAWTELLTRGHASDSSRPAKTWLAEAKEPVGRIGEEAFASQAAAWLARVKPRPQPKSEGLLQALTAPSPLMHEANARCVRGLVWAASLVASPALARAVADLGLVTFRKLPDYGPYSAKVGNACVFTLGAMPGLDGIAQLGRLRLKVKYVVAQKLVEKALLEAAERAGMPPEELEELCVPTFGLDEEGARREELGGYTAELRVVGASDAEIRWLTPGGKPQKSIPAAVKKAHAEELKQLKQAAKDIEAQLPAERQRLERLLLSERPLPYPRWQERYRRHPLLAPLVRRLIWHFRKGDREALGVVQGEALVDGQERPLAWVDEATEVRLWHPLGFEPGVVLEWRRWLLDHEVTQPFKQAHREIYVLTDAEHATDTYSNRFAAHILRQHPFAALCRERGWRYHLQGQWDSHNVPTLPLPRWGMSAEFWVDPLWEDSQASDMGIYLNVSTDQVRFTDRAGVPLPLVRVPALLFSEVMRDVDLFVSVTSIATDPTWHDRGPQEARTYWERYAFGDLSASAEERRKVLETLLPKLTIAPRCRIEGRFLHVQGDLRAYQIHLGSGNIKMEPNGQYLCIVPDRGRGARDSPTRDLVLPFEGDTTLAVILSKALMLAADAKIQDETILRQIRI